MYRIYWNNLLVLSVLLILNTNLNHGVSIKMTNAVCTSYNKSWIVVNHCRLKAVQRNKTIFNADVEFLHPANEIDMRVQIQKKASGYKPWLIDISFDACKYMRKPNNPAIKMIHGLFKEFSTVNHTCPYSGYQEIKDFYPTAEALPVQLPTGDYLLTLTFIFSKQRTFDVKVYFSYIEDLI